MDILANIPKEPKFSTDENTTGILRGKVTKVNILMVNLLIVVNEQLS